MHQASLDESSGIKFMARMEDDEAFPHFLEFISQYGKTDYTEQEFNNRFEIFKANLIKINAHNSLGDEADFQMGVN